MGTLYGADLPAVVDQAIFELQTKARSRHGSYLHHCRRICSEVDQENTGYLSREQVDNVLSYWGTFLAKLKFEAILKYCTVEGRGFDYNKFLNTLIPKLNPRCQRVVDAAWKVAAGESESVPLEDLARRFSPMGHSGYVLGKIPGERVQHEFFEGLIHLRLGSDEPVVKDDFVAYYTEKRLDCLDDDAFAKLVEAQWKVEDLEAEPTLRQFRELVTKIKQKARLKNEGVKDEVSLKAHFLQVANEKGEVPRDQFAGLLRGMGVDVRDADADALFRYFDKNKSDSVSAADLGKYLATFEMEAPTEAILSKTVVPARILPTSTWAP
mmetsp:Transcript_40693/g.97610  ORF Transcript_40693/g.97610 Transcript_40693/m.97610 type:complete len:324 (+) Transcript_40693:50-1021(+)